MFKILSLRMIFYRVGVSAIFSLVFINAFSQHLSGNLNNLSFVNNLEASKSSNFLLHKVYNCATEIQRFNRRDQSLQYFRDDEIILRANDVILTRKEGELRKLLFLGLYYDSKEKIKEARYFYKNKYDKIKLEYFFQREKIIRRFGQPIMVENLTNLTKATWKVNQLILEHWMEKKVVKNEGAIFLSIKPVKTRKQNYKFAPKQKEDKIHLSLKTPASDTTLTSNLENTVVTTSSMSIGTLLNVSRPTSFKAEGFDGASVISRLNTNDKLELLDIDSNFYYAKVRFNSLEGWVNKSLLFRSDNK